MATQRSRRNARQPNQGEQGNANRLPTNGSYNDFQRSMMEVMGRCGLKNTDNSYARRASMKFITINQFEEMADLRIIPYNQAKD